MNSASPTSQAGDARAAINDCWNKIGVHGNGQCKELPTYIHCRNCPVYGAAAATLLDGDLPSGYSAAWTTHFAQKKQLGQLDSQAALVFRIGEEWLALPSRVISEVVDMRAIHVLPHRQNEVLRGLTSVRGELLVCVSLGNLLGVGREQTMTKTRQREAYWRLVVIHGEGGRLVFPANEVHGIVHYHPGELREVPATVSKSTATYTTAVLPWGDKSIGCIDDQLLFYTLNRSLA